VNEQNHEAGKKQPTIKDISAKVFDVVGDPDRRALDHDVGCPLARR
jgi:hypothetical protein